MSVAAPLHKIPQVIPISFGKVGYTFEVDVLGNGHPNERITSNGKGGICYDSRSKHDQRSKSG
jgi:hypothetical protein